MWRLSSLPTNELISSSKIALREYLCILVILLLDVFEPNIHMRGWWLNWDFIIDLIFFFFDEPEYGKILDKAYSFRQTFLQSSFIWLQKVSLFFMMTIPKIFSSWSLHKKWLILIFNLQKLGIEVRGYGLNVCSLTWKCMFLKFCLYCKIPLAFLYIGLIPNNKTAICFNQNCNYLCFKWFNILSVTKSGVFLVALYI